MALRVTNTLTGEKEVFEPADPDSVLLYYCGLTVSDRAHLGHARSWVHVDVMHRWLEHLGYGVRHVENFTDVNEKIVARIGEDGLGDSEAAVAREFLGATLADMRALNLKRAAVYPRVSEHVPAIIDLVATLIESGHAYESAGSVYFDVTTFPEYGKLSNQTLDGMEAQGDPDEREEKRHPADFALWKAGGVNPGAVAEHRREDHPDTGHEDTGDEDAGDSSGDPTAETDAPNGQTWDSPWGEGRPGWHIECSAMSMAHLGETIDIHVGGRDLVFPHHENEVAQSEAATGEEFVRYWLHADLFAFEDDKMSTSLGNFVTVEDAIEKYGTNTIRAFLLAGTYNSTQTYSDRAIVEAGERWERLDRAHERASAALDGPDALATVVDESLRDAADLARETFTDAMNDDFNTREAIAALLDLATALNRHLDARERYDYEGVHEAVEVFETFGEGVLGFSFAGDTEGDAHLAGEIADLVLDVREREREAGNYERADALRADLEALGVEVEDTDDGPRARLDSGGGNSEQR